MNTYPNITDPAEPKPVGAAVLLMDSRKRILIVHGIGKPHWNFPGGGVEKGESPYQAALRETKEEIGLTLPNAKFLCVDYRMRANGEESLSFLFLGPDVGDADIAAIQLQPSEIDEYRLLETEEAYKLLNPALVLRLKSVLGDTNLKYLENGLYVTG
jgi:8-oxo-dGTP pyrophosphatase MutT (NUDIX family)